MGGVSTYKTKFISSAKYQLCWKYSHTNLYIKNHNKLQILQCFFLFLRSQSRTKILAYQKICTFTIRTKIFLTASEFACSRSYFDHTKHIWSLKLFLEQVLLHWFFLDKVTSRWKPQYTIFYLHIFLVVLDFFYKKYKKDFEFEFERLGDSYTE